MLPTVPLKPVMISSVLFSNNIEACEAERPFPLIVETVKLASVSFVVVLITLTLKTYKQNPNIRH